VACSILAPSEIINNTIVPSFQIKLLDQYNYPTWTQEPSGRVPAKIRLTCKSSVGNDILVVTDPFEVKNGKADVNGLRFTAPPSAFTRAAVATATAAIVAASSSTSNSIGNHNGDIGIDFKVEALKDDGKRFVGVPEASATVRLYPSRVPTSILFGTPPTTNQTESKSRPSSPVSSPLTSLTSLPSPTPLTKNGPSSSSTSSLSSTSPALTRTFSGRQLHRHSITAHPHDLVTFSVQLFNEVNQALLLKAPDTSADIKSSITAGPGALSGYADGKLYMTVNGCDIKDHLLWTSQPIESKSSDDDDTDSDDETDTDNDEKDPLDPPSPPRYAASTTSGRKRNAATAQLHFVKPVNTRSGRIVSTRRVVRRRVQADPQRVVSKADITQQVHVSGTQLFVQFRVPDMPNTFGLTTCSLRFQRSLNSATIGSPLEFDLNIEYGNSHYLVTILPFCCWCLIKVLNLGKHHKCKFVYAQDFKLPVGHPWNESLELCRVDEFSNIIPLDVSALIYVFSFMDNFGCRHRNGYHCWVTINSHLPPHVVPYVVQLSIVDPQMVKVPLISVFLIVKLR
jgi:hypothetical protein